MKQSRVKWTNWDRGALLGLGLTLTVAFFYWLVPTSTFIDIIGYEIDSDGYETLSYKLPFGSVNTMQQTEIIVINSGGLECSTYGLKYFTTNRDNTIINGLGPWADPCEKAKKPYLVRKRWQAIFLGWLRLRPMEREWQFEGNREGPPEFLLEG